jgi:AcrR family transcriptional regulator
VLRAAVSFADERGLASLSMRKLGQRLGVEAMSLYNHVAGKDDLLDGIVEMVVDEFELPSGQAPWREALRQAALSKRRVLLRHPWAAPLIESRVTPTLVRFRYGEAVLGTLRRGGFSVDLAYRAQLAISSYVHGFTLQEINWPFEPKERHQVAETLQPQLTPDDHPHLIEMLGWIMRTRDALGGAKDGSAYAPDFEFGLDLILDGLERLSRQSSARER